MPENFGSQSWVDTSKGDIGAANYVDNKLGNGGLNPPKEEVKFWFRFEKKHYFRHKAQGFMKLIWANWLNTLKRADEIAKTCEEGQFVYAQFNCPSSNFDNPSFRAIKKVPFMVTRIKTLKRSTMLRMEK